MRRQQEILRRLRAVEDEIAGMARLVEQGDACLAAVRRGLAARRALSGIGLALLEAHLRKQVAAVLACDGPDCRAHHVALLAETYQALTRLLCPACRGEWSGLCSPAYRENRERTHVVAPD